MTLQPGLIFQIATEAGIQLRGSGDKRTCKCPFHDDRNASAFVSASNCFFCSVCTPDHGWSLKKFTEALGVAPPDLRTPSRQPARQVEQTVPPLTPTEAHALWTASLARARDDEQLDCDRAVHDYIARRGLGEALELGAYGILPTSGLPSAVSKWPGSGYRLVAPLFSSSGEITSIQARAIVPATLKTLNPTGSRIAGTVFADRGGQRVLAGERVDRLIYGEGLTDMLALAITSPWPVLTAPGTSNAVAGVGSWAKDVEVLLALDRDEAGDRAAGAVRDALYRYGARRVRRIRWPSKAKDACEVLEQRGTAAFQILFERLSSQEAS